MNRGIEPSGTTLEAGPLPADAKKYYKIGKIGMTVKVIGRRSGT